jgi:hypothetical protein
VVTILTTIQAHLRNPGRQQSLGNQPTDLCRRVATLRGVRIGGKLARPGCRDRAASNIINGLAAKVPITSLHRQPDAITRLQLIADAILASHLLFRQPLNFVHFQASKYHAQLTSSIDPTNIRQNTAAVHAAASTTAT